MWILCLAVVIGALTVNTLFVVIEDRTQVVIYMKFM